VLADVGIVVTLADVLVDVVLVGVVVEVAVVGTEMLFRTNVTAAGPIEITVYVPVTLGL
jgi:hypothetical protein